tara:strand:- start:11388 stop:11975 length:588 start_codon:yes stop_codon:yes gene_type:complete
MRFRFKKTALSFTVATITSLSGCSSTPFEAQNIQRLLNSEEKTILTKAYKKSPCDDNIYSPLLLSIQDRRWRPKKSKESMCDLLKPIRWIDSNTCASSTSHATIEEEFQAFHGASLQEVCYLSPQHNTIDPIRGTISVQSKHDMVELMQAAVECEAVRYSFIELTSNETVGPEEYQKVSALIEMCLNKQKATTQR